MNDLSPITDARLQQDLSDAKEDVGWCNMALALNLVILDDGTSIEWRRDENLKQIVIIEAEIAKRANG